MSKFSERLSSLGQSAPAKMGFGQSAAREKNPVMLVVGRNGAGSDDSVDLVLTGRLNDGTAFVAGDHIQVRVPQRRRCWYRWRR